MAKVGTVLKFGKIELASEDANITELSDALFLIVGKLGYPEQDIEDIESLQEDLRKELVEEEESSERLNEGDEVKKGGQEVSPWLRHGQKG